MIKAVIDRFEGDFAVIELEDRRIVNIPIVFLPRGSKEGDVINVMIDENETEKRKMDIESKLSTMINR